VGLGSCGYLGGTAADCTRRSSQIGGGERPDGAQSAAIARNERTMNMGVSTMPARGRCLVSVVFALAFTSVHAEGTAPFTSEAMWGLARLGAPTLSPDGAHAVLPVTRYDLDENKGDADLWIV